MTLSEVLLNECSGMTNDEALVYLKEHKTLVDGMAKSGDVLAYLAAIGKLKYLKTLNTDISEACVITLETREGFDFSNPLTRQLLDTFVPSLITEENANYIQSLGQHETLTFPTIRKVDIVRIRGDD